MTTPQKIAANIALAIRGKDDIIDLLLVALCANGHVLIEDVPGVGKTTLAKALAASIRAEFRRLQFTPDLLPTDITGGMVYSPKTGEFAFTPGPVFCNILLADEINRATPRTQSALLEAMNEGQVSIEGVRRPLQSPFMVIATQNPIEYHGTYPLPEAQLDRFMLKFRMGYPDAEHEIDILNGQRQGRPIDMLKPVAEAGEIAALQEAVRNVAMEASVTEYLATLVRHTRQDPRLRLGASPRAALALYRGAQARAFLKGRQQVVPDDIKALAAPVLEHRVMLDNGAAVSGIGAAGVIQEIVERTAVPT